MFYNLGLVLGLSVRDIDSLTAGELLDFSYYRANKEDERRNKVNSEKRIKATQADYDAF